MENSIDGMNILAIFLSALVSGLLATIITLLFQSRAAKRNQKMKIFETLLHFRYDYANEENVRALITVDVFFYDDKNVRGAYRSFVEETKKGPIANNEDKYLLLIEEMAKSLKLKNINWDYYCPAGVAFRIKEKTDMLNTQIWRSLRGSVKGFSQK